MREMVKYGFILGLICFLASGILATVNAITEPKIQLQKEQKENAGLKEVMPEAFNFKPKIKQGEIVYYTAYDTSNRIKGFVIKAEGKGYSSQIEALSGLDLKLQVTQVKILAQNETPGLGNRIMDVSFLSQFKGKGLDSFNQVQAITGATISSFRVIKSVENKIRELKEELLKELSYAR